jgi:hypothetical protein
MLSPLSACGQGSKLRAVLAATALVFTAHAGTFIVNTTGDTHAVSPGTSANDSGGHISLRSATEAADAQGGPATINVPAGAYNLSLGELDVSPNGAQTVVISGAGAGGTMVSQTDPTNRVFNIDFNSIGGTTTTLSGLTIQGGHDGADELGGAGIQLRGAKQSLHHGHDRATRWRHPDGRGQPEDQRLYLQQQQLRPKLGRGSLHAGTIGGVGPERDERGLCQQHRDEQFRRGTGWRRRHHD